MKVKHRLKLSREEKLIAKLLSRPPIEYKEFLGLVKKLSLELENYEEQLITYKVVINNYYSVLPGKVARLVASASALYDIANEIREVLD